MENIMIHCTSHHLTFIDLDHRIEFTYLYYNLALFKILDDLMFFTFADNIYLKFFFYNCIPFIVTPNKHFFFHNSHPHSKIFFFLYLFCITIIIFIDILGSAYSYSIIILLGKYS